MAEKTAITWCDATFNQSRKRKAAAGRTLDGVEHNGFPQ